MFQSSKRSIINLEDLVVPFFLRCFFDGFCLVKWNLLLEMHIWLLVNDSFDPS